MSFVVPSGFYLTKVTALASTSKTEVFDVNDDTGEDRVYVLGIKVVDSTGAVSAGATVHALIDVNGAERVLGKVATVDTEYGFEISGLPISLGRGGTISVTGASGHHVWVGYLIGTPDSAQAQR